MEPAVRGLDFHTLSRGQVRVKIFCTVLDILKTGSFRAPGVVKNAGNKQIEYRYFSVPHYLSFQEDG